MLSCRLLIYEKCFLNIPQLLGEGYYVWSLFSYVFDATNLSIHYWLSGKYGNFITWVDQQSQENFASKEDLDHRPTKVSIGKINLKLLQPKYYHQSRLRIWIYITKIWTKNLPGFQMTWQNGSKLDYFCLPSALRSLAPIWSWDLDPSKKDLNQRTT